MKTRSIKILLGLLKQRVKEDTNFLGMCWNMDELFFNDIITSLEHDELDEYLTANTPKYHDGYWWKQGDKAPRHRWLNKHIKKN